jgi:uncharacterized protein YlxW (UPF0749 family)
LPNPQDFNLSVYLWQIAPALAIAVFAVVIVWRRYTAKGDEHLADLRSVVRGADGLNAVAASNATLASAVTTLTAKVESFSAQLAEQHEECERLREMVRERIAVEAAESNLRKAGPQSVRGR